MFYSSNAVAITQLSWRPRALLVDQFDSKEDVINAVITSSFIPGYEIQLSWFFKPKYSKGNPCCS
jgi:hypothetical protein